MKKNIDRKKKISLLARCCAAILLASTLTAAWSGCDGEWIQPSQSVQSGGQSSDPSDNGCRHDVGDWTVVKEATCMTEGEETGLCAECFQEVKRAISVNASAHEYGEWEVTAIPAQENAGTAKKTCALNGEHILTETLPPLTDKKYVSEVVKLPSALGNGERQYSYEHPMGAITFIEPISANGIQTVRDAVEIASSDVSHALIRRAEGSVGWEYHAPAYEGYTDPETGVTGTRPKEDQKTTHEYMYEFGEEYTHIDRNTYDDTERWYAVQNGELYGFAEYGGNDFVNETELGVAGAENYYDGFRFTLMTETGLGAFYGAENLLAGLYKIARLSENEDFKESKTQEDGETIYTFQFGHHDGNVDDGYFGTVRVEFIMTEEYTISYLSVRSIVYANNAGLDASTGGKFDTWELVEVNGKEVARAKEGVSTRNGAHYIDSIEVYQTTALEAADEPIPVNPYPLESSMFSSFDFVCNGKTIGENDVVDCVAGKTVYFSIENIYPASALESGKDRFRYYYRDKKGIDHELDYSSLDMVGMTVYSGANSFFRSHIAGEIELVVKTVNLEKIIHLDVEPIKPSAIYPTAFVYTRSGYFENKMSTQVRAATVYAGQPFYYTATSSAMEANYTDPSSTSSVSGVTGAYILKDNVPYEELPLSIQSANARSVSMFVCDTPGTYTLTMRCNKDNSVRCSIQVTVEKAPAIDEILSDGAYMQELNYPVRGKVSVNFTKTNGVTEANIDFNGRTTVLLCEYDEATKKLTTTNKNGEGLFGDTVYNFSLAINEAYDLVLSHPIGEQLGGLTETVVLRRDVNEILTGAYEGVTSTGELVALRFQTEGSDKQLRAEIVYGDGRATLVCSYSITQDTLTSVIESGDAEMSLQLNKAYQLLLTYEGEEILLTRT